MSKKKITRRQAILGTAIAGVAGTSAIVYVLRSRYETELPDGVWKEVPLPQGLVVGKNPDFGKEWKRDLTLVNIPTKEISGPSTFKLNYKPEVGAKYRLVFLNAAYSKQVDPAKFPERPTFYNFVEGMITAVPPLVDDKPALSISKAKIASNSSMIKGGEASGDNCVVVMQNGSLDFYEIEQGGPQKVPRAKVGPACSVLGSQLALDYPKEKPLSLGTKWTLSSTALETGLEASERIDLNCEVVGFAEVAGRKTVKMQAEKHLTAQAYAGAVAAAGGSGPQEVTIRSGAAKGPNGTEIAKVERLVSDEGESTGRADQILRDGISKEIHLVTYVDLTTGVPVRRELTQTLNNSKHPNRSLTTYTFSQVLEG